MGKYFHPQCVRNQQTWNVKRKSLTNFKTWSDKFPTIVLKWKQFYWCPRSVSYKSQAKFHRLEGIRNGKKPLGLSKMCTNCCSVADHSLLQLAAGHLSTSSFKRWNPLQFITSIWWGDKEHQSLFFFTLQSTSWDAFHLNSINASWCLFFPPWAHNAKKKNCNMFISKFIQHCFHWPDL